MTLEQQLGLMVWFWIMLSSLVFVHLENKTIKKMHELSQIPLDLPAAHTAFNPIAGFKASWFFLRYRPTPSDSVELTKAARFGKAIQVVYFTQLTALGIGFVVFFPSK